MFVTEVDFLQIAQKHLKLIIEGFIEYFNIEWIW